MVGWLVCSEFNTLIIQAINRAYKRYILEYKQVIGRSGVAAIWDIQLVPSMHSISTYGHICYEFQLEHQLKTLFWFCNFQITSESRFWVTFFPLHWFCGLWISHLRNIHYEITTLWRIFPWLHCWRLSLSSYTVCETSWLKQCEMIHFLALQSHEHLQIFLSSAE